MWWMLVGLVFFLVVYYVSKRPAQFPPGPSWFPVVGCFPQFMKLRSQLGYIHLVWEELTRQYGPLVGLRLGKDRIVVVSGIEPLKHVLSREDCDGRPDGFFFRMRALGQRLGLVFIDGSPWQEQRRFSTRHLRNLGFAHDAMERLLVEEVQALIESMQRICCHNNQGTKMALHNLCDISVLNALWTVVAGHRFELSDRRLHEIFTLQHESFRALDMSGGIVNQMPFLRFVAPDRSGYTTLIRAIHSIYAFLEEIIAEHKKTLIPGQPRDLIDAYLDEINSRNEEKDSTFHENQLLVLCLDLFMAGSETTSVTLGFLLLYLLHYPDIMQRMQEEIEHVVGSHRLPDLTDRPKMPYVEAVIMEVLRHISVAPVAVPHCTTEDCMIMGYRVPKDTVLLASIWSVHMDREHWGDPEVFRPERFLTQHHTIIKDNWFMPFGMGKRRCLGETLARNNLFVFLAGLLQNFDFSLIPGEDPPTFDALDGITLSPKPFYGVVRMRPQK